MMTRRRIVSLLPALVAGMHVELHGQTKFFTRKSKKKPAVTPEPVIYFGTGTKSNAIYGARFDTVKGQLRAPAMLAQCVAPTFLADAPKQSGRVLYAVGEGDAQHSSVAAFAVDATTGGLKLLGAVPSGGAGPCYVALSADGRTAYVANYAGGSVAALRVNADGSLQAPGQVVDLRGLHKYGPVAGRQDGSHPHCATLAPSDRFLLVSDLGSDTISTFPVEEGSGRLGAPHVNEVRPPGAGPRHLVFHPNGRWVYAVDELANRIDLYLWNTVHASNGAPEEALLTDAAHSVSTVDANFHGKNTAAEIAFGPGGNFVYVSNRGENSLAVFAVNAANGALTLVQRIACGGNGPRHFAIDSSGRWVLVCNEASDNVCVFARDLASGRLAGPVQTIALPQPMFALLLTS